MTHKARLILTLAVSALALAGCQSTKEAFRFGDAKNPNPGPCPNAQALFDAARIVKIDGEETMANVGFTGEINGVRSFCRYYGEQPIRSELEIDFGFGRGPDARGDEHVYNYFVAVTRKDLAVIEKQVFPLRVDFKGRDRVYMTETIDNIVIPRANETTSGTNFEIIVGFEVNEQQLEYNRLGKRFREGIIQAPSE